MSYIHVSIDIDDFLSNCTSYDIKYIINALIEDGHLPENVITNSNNNPLLPGEEFHMEYCSKIASRYYQMTKEETDFIEQLAKKYG